MKQKHYQFLAHQIRNLFLTKNKFSTYNENSKCQDVHKLCPKTAHKKANLTHKSSNWSMQFGILCVREQSHYHQITHTWHTLRWQTSDHQRSPPESHWEGTWRSAWCGCCRCSADPLSTPCGPAAAINKLHSSWPFCMVLKTKEAHTMKIWLRNLSPSGAGWSAEQWSH